MKLFLICLLAAVASAKVITTVTVNPQAIEPTKSEVTLPCEFTLVDSGDDKDQPPIIYWIKGISVDDIDAVVMFKGFRYWNESFGEYRQFFNGYEGRATVPDLDHPSIVLTGVNNADEGRYWCMVAEWSGRQQEGTDADSIALLKTTETFVDTNPGGQAAVDEGNSITLPCSGKGAHDIVTWYEGPFHLADTENFTHTEIGTYSKIGFFDLVNEEVFMNTEEFPKMSIDKKRSLIVSNTEVRHAGRYWCELSNSRATNFELESARASTLLEIKVEAFDCTGQEPGLYPDPVDCSMYYECSAGNPITYHRSCGYDGLVFDERFGYCDWAANVPPPCGTNSS